MLLNVSRGQWSMYDSGKRDLPLAAKNRLITIISHLQNEETSKQTQKLLASEEREAQELLEKDLAELVYAQQHLDRKILAIENKRTASFAALETVHFLKTQKMVTASPTLLKSIKTRAANVLKKNSLYELQDLLLKKGTSR
jgi:hypothetical protein